MEAASLPEKKNRQDDVAEPASSRSTRRPDEEDDFEVEVFPPRSARARTLPVTTTPAPPTRRMRRGIVSMSECESFNHYKKYCPARSVVVNRAPPSCLSSLHSGDRDHVLKLCPVVLVDEAFPYVASLAFGVFAVYTKPKLMTKVYCGEEQVATQELQGLTRITLRRDCRLVHDNFVLEPTIDFGDQDNELSEIPLTFDNDLNMLQVLSWDPKMVY